MPDPIPDTVFPVHLIGGRVELRELTQEDLVPIAEYAADPEVMRYVVFGRTFSTAEEREWLMAMIAAAREPRRADYTLAVVVDGDVAGTAHLGLENRLHFRGFLGYALRKQFWGRGLATEAASLLVSFGFDQLRLHRVHASVAPANQASIRVLEKVGLRYEGHARDHFATSEGWRDSLMFGILEADRSVGGTD